MTKPTMNAIYNTYKISMCSKALGSRIVNGPAKCGCFLVSTRALSKVKIEW